MAGAFPIETTSKMIDITTTYAGLQLKNPIVAASSGLTSNINKIKELAAQGVGAIVLKSLFEEQIEMQGQSMLEHTDYPEAADYIAQYVRGEQVNQYLDLISQAKQSTDVPVIASINCFRADAWADFAGRIEQAGADAIELNVMRLETDLFAKESYEDQYVAIVASIVKAVKIPVTVKLSRTLSNIPALVDKLRATGAKGIVLFNRSYRTDVDIETESLCSGNVFSQPTDICDTLRYTGICSALIPGVSLAASTGVHGWEEVVKCILVGSSAVQMCSALYKGGSTAIKEAILGLTTWMERKGYRSIEEFRGRLNAADIKSATMFERMQFMKYFSRHESN
ncbi:Dihydroorotate dehydrogenase B (NAD(+)), catalytic subunit [Porphyromonas crevioricanis]|uniref:Dihydroorotate dehydrogenase B (NAD(+)), catalytic subunit n=1 Tax=Porphyromonas crevioricanis TaxID=393921 RepID=A0A2X4PKZ8_9PORP|nr:dihydroorotate dehydrogenase [Porphyromonas crevioricanis JCM 13913]SQH73015.1 Dihydroorotate dehydrogenase B (NAD(+)), catalytic subunit [Porphyromonas crevioricanis]